MYDDKIDIAPLLKSKPVQTDSPEVSIIIPIYRAEKWIERCLHSIAIQTFTDYEVIFIDDASDDSSMQKMEDFLLKNPLNHQLLRQPYHQKQGAARNRGLEIAKGKYILFVDADDQLADQNSLQLLHSAIKHTSYDFVVGGTTKQKKEDKKPSKTLKGIATVSALSHFEISSSPWNKLIKKSFLIQHNILFSEGRYFEDTLWNIKLCNAAQTIYLLKHPTYQYNTNNTNAVTYHFSLCKNRQLAHEIQSMLSYIQQHYPINSTTKRIYKRFVNEIIYWALYKTYQDTSKADFIKSYHLLHNTYKNSFLTKRYYSYSAPYLLYFTLWMQHHFWQKHIKRVIKYLVRKMIFPTKTKR